MADFPKNDRLSIKTMAAKAAKETDQATQKRYVRTILEAMWKRYNDQLRYEGHELVLLAVPTYPANIEAVSALDLSDINDIMAVFAKHREDHPDELRPIEPDTIPPPQSPREIIRQGVAEAHAADRSIEVGQGNDGGGPPQERAEPAPEPNEGDAAGDAMGQLREMINLAPLREELKQRILDTMGSGSVLDPIGTPLREQGFVEEEPVFELFKASTMAGIEQHIRIWSNGRVEGWDGAIINRMPQRASIDTSDIPEVGEEWFKKAELVMPVPGRAKPKGD